VKEDVQDPVFLKVTDNEKTAEGNLPILYSKCIRLHMPGTSRITALICAKTDDQASSWLKL
jgi:hypothetical protein